ncbi:unnamed protein product [Linum trigynum]|uniref:Uncharacterized protein n=1 Tax=Linum trigynum TaxID=586398 RepID=A0AAV2CK78_9ROSI
MQDWQNLRLLRLSLDPEQKIDDLGILHILPVLAESTGMLPNRQGNRNGSDILLEAIVEAEVARNAKHFFV